MTIEPHRIDVHNHIFPKNYLASLTSVGIKNAVGEPFPQWILKTLLLLWIGKEVRCTNILQKKKFINL